VARPLLTRLALDDGVRIALAWQAILLEEPPAAVGGGAADTRLATLTA
jgi:hypothetical protein